jgi:hypothetical protein
MADPAESNEEARWLAERLSSRVARERLVGRAFAVLAAALVLAMVLALR